MAEHVDDDAAAFLTPVVPGGPLRRYRVALEDPVAELATHREDAPEEAGVDQHLQLLQPGQPQLVLHHAVLDARGLRQRIELVGFLRGERCRLLAVDVLARRDCSLHRIGTAVGSLRVKIDDVVRVGQGALQVRGPLLDPGGVRERLQLGRVAPDEDRIGQDDLLVADLHPALPDDSHDRAHQVLVRAHAPRHAVHDDSDLVCLDLAQR